MAQLLVRNLEDKTKTRLARRAKRHGRSMEEEVREILRNALREDDTPALGLGTAIAKLFQDAGVEDEIPELRGHIILPAHFEP